MKIIPRSNSSDPYVSIFFLLYLFSPLRRRRGPPCFYFLDTRTDGRGGGEKNRRTHFRKKERRIRSCDRKHDAPGICRIEKNCEREGSRPFTGRYVQSRRIYGNPFKPSSIL